VEKGPGKNGGSRSHRRKRSGRRRAQRKKTKKEKKKTVEEKGDAMQETPGTLTQQKRNKVLRYPPGPPFWESQYKGTDRVRWRWRGGGRGINGGRCTKTKKKNTKKKKNHKRISRWRDRLEKTQRGGGTHDQEEKERVWDIVNPQTFRGKDLYRHC